MKPKWLMTRRCRLIWFRQRASAVMLAMVWNHKFFQSLWLWGRKKWLRKLKVKIRISYLRRMKRTKKCLRKSLHPLSLSNKHRPKSQPSTSWLECNLHKASGKHLRSVLSNSSSKANCQPTSAAKLFALLPRCSFLKKTSVTDRMSGSWSRRRLKPTWNHRGCHSRRN